MSFLSKLGKIAGRVLPGVISGAKFGPVGSIVGGGLAFAGGSGDVNIANRLSKQVGCTIAQSDANQARAMLAKGIDPCTGRSTANVGVPTTVPPVEAGASPFAQQTLFTLQDILKRSRGPTPSELGFPVPSREVLRTPALPAAPIPVRSFGGQPRMSAMFPLQTQMAAIGPLVAMAGRVGISAAVKRKIITLAKAVGIQAAATAIGMSVIDVADVIANPPRRRRKGITGAQLANAKRVNRAVMCMANQLQTTCGPARRAPARRKTACR